MKRFLPISLLLLSTLLPCFSEDTSPHEQYWTEQESIEDGALKKAPDVKSLFFKTVVLLVGITGTLVGATWLLKRTQGAKFSSLSSEGAIQLIERKYLSPKTSLWLVEVNKKPIIVVESQFGVSIQHLKEETSLEKHD